MRVILGLDAPTAGWVRELFKTLAAIRVTS
jgi:hypothetical protein